MSFKLAELFVSITADSKAFQTGIEAVHGSVSRLQGSLRAVSNAAQGVFMMAGSLLAGVAAAAGAYESAMARVRAVTQANNDEFQYLIGITRQLSQTTMFSAKEHAEAARILALAGFQIKEIAEALPSIANLAAAGEVPLENAANHAVRIMRGMGIGAELFAGAVDMMVKATVDANAEVSDLATAMSYIGPVANLSKTAFNEVAAAVMLVSNAGIIGERAGTGIRRFMAELSREASPARNNLRDLGVETMDAAGQMRPIAKIIGELDIALKKTMPDAQRLGYLIEVFGLRAGPAVAALLAAGGKGIEEYQAKLAKAGGIAKHVADIQLETLFGRLKVMKNAVLEMSIAFGNVLIPALNQMINHIQRTYRAFSQLSEQTRQNISAATILTMALSGVTVGLTKVLGILAAISAHPIVALITALVALVTTLFYVSTAGKNLEEKMVNMWNRVMSIIGPVIEFVSEQLRGLSEVMSKFGNWLLSNWPRWWEEAVNFIRPLLVGFQLMVSQVWTAISQSTSAIWNGIRDTVAGAWNFIAKNIGPVLTWIRDAIITAFAAMSFAVEEWRLLLDYSFTWVAYQAVKLANQIQYAFNVMKTSVVWFGTNLIDILETAFDYAVTVIKNFGINMAGLLPEAFRYGIATAIKFVAEGLTYLAQLFIDTNIRILKGIYWLFTEGIPQAVSWCFAKLFDLVKWIFFEAIPGALSWLYETWKSVVSAIYEFFLNFIQKAATSVWDFFFKTMPEALSYLWNNWRNIFTDIWNYTKNTFINLAENIKNFFDAVYNWLTDTDWKFAWKPLMDGFKSSIKEMPEIAGRVAGETEARLGSELEDTGKKLGDKWQAHLKNFKEIAYAPSAPEGEKKPALEPFVSKPLLDSKAPSRSLGEAAKELGAFVGDGIVNTVKQASLFRGIEELGRKIQEAAIKKDDIPSKQLEQLKQINRKMGDKSPEFNPLVGP